MFPNYTFLQRFTILSVALSTLPLFATSDESQIRTVPTAITQSSGMLPIRKEG